jgi:hypothetical protein
VRARTCDHAQRRERWSHKFASGFHLCDASQDLLRRNIRFDSIPSKKICPLAAAWLREDSMAARRIALSNSCKG